MHMKTRLSLLCLLILSLFGVVVAPVSADSGDGPRTFLMNYFTTLNHRELEAAYGMWRAPTFSFSSFWGGYDDTHHVLPYFGDVQVTDKPSGQVYVPMILVA